MTTQLVSTHEAKSRLSELIRAAHDGDAVVILRNGHPVARLIPWPDERPVRLFGQWAGSVEYGPDLVGADVDVAELFDESAAVGP